MQICARRFFTNSPQQQLAVEESAAIHDRSRALLSEVDQRGGLVILENPATSMTFDDPLIVQWIQAVAPFAAQASACQFGKDWAKTWMFVANGKPCGDLCGGQVMPARLWRAPADLGCAHG